MFSLAELLLNTQELKSEYRPEDMAQREDACVGCYIGGLALYVQYTRPFFEQNFKYTCFCASVLSQLSQK